MAQSLIEAMQKLKESFSVDEQAETQQERDTRIIKKINKLLQEVGWPDALRILATVIGMLAIQHGHSASVILRDLFSYEDTK